MVILWGWSLDTESAGERAEGCNSHKLQYSLSASLPVYENRYSYNNYQ